MRRRFSFICIYLCLLSLFCFGAAEVLFLDEGERVSLTENRVLEPRPALTGGSLVSGEFMDRFESFLSDGFFFRDVAADFHDSCMEVFSVPDDGPDTGEVADEQLWEGNTSEPETAENEVDSALAAEIPAEPESVSPETPDASDARLWLVRSDGTEETIFTYPASSLISFADILNRLRAMLPADGSVFFANPQVSAVANNVILSGKYAGWGSDLEDVMQPLADPGVYIVDCTDILSPYMDQRCLYPIEDYHWHASAASLTVDALMRRQGLPPAEYEQYRYYLSFKHNNVAYTTDMLGDMRYGADAIEIPAAVSPAESYILTYLTERRPGVFTMSEGGYVGFLGGHKGPWRLIRGGFHTGRNALVIGDCFIPPMIPYMAPYYDTIITTDVRDNFYSVERSGANIRDYIREYDVDDVYVIYSTNSRFTSDSLQSRLLKYLDLEYPG